MTRRSRPIALLAERGFVAAGALRFPYARLMTSTMVRDALDEDSADNDITSLATVVSDRRARCTVVAREAGVIAGIPLAREAFKQRNPRAVVRNIVKDGQRIEARGQVMFITGHARGLLSAERVALNFMQRLSGIATMTSQFVDAVEGTGAKILDTRKTTPGWRRLEKYAVRAGGGLNHRMDLAAAVLIKDNHLVAVDGHIAMAVKRARDVAPAGTPVEVECDRIEQVLDAINAEVEIIMLDNMNLDDMRESVELIDGRAVTEASGGVTLDTVRGLAKTGVDWISVGALTHSVKALDLGLDFE